jgi:GLPGLI family protein
MKQVKYVLLFLFLFYFQKGYNQNVETAKIEVKYNFSYLIDTLTKSIYSEIMVLYIGDFASEFKSFDKISQDSALLQELRKNVRSENNIVINGHSKNLISWVVYKFNNDFFIKQTTVKEYLMKDVLPKINWEIIDSTKEIFGITCQKAVGDFRGRTYEVWFTTSMPLSFGPWKLSGLPGLIIEASDTKKQVNFFFAGLRKLNNSSILIKIPENVIHTTKKDYENMREAMLNNPNEYLKNTMGVSIRSSNNLPIRTRKKSNNPLELTE